MGFCYDDKKSQVFCYYCGVIISPLQNEEEIWTNHAFLTTDCCILRNQMGEKAIQEAREKYKRHSNETGRKREKTRDGEIERDFSKLTTTKLNNQQQNY
ncbi:hypothetical protein TSAR_011276 [Trichomalopsis sarcophagae]|uniref:Uncharacterized protein n=1 Tax=Trichomalopsis sarcophagae TaxID=543379 RepID=A0A232EJX2_9HYME|nr:hypothetical protein TSAR_011276 [Trichomalopsis sarcophagae]